MPKKILRHEPFSVTEPPIEVIDDAGKTLLIMPQAQILRQRLRHRTVLVCLRNAKGLLYLFKRPIITPGEQRRDAWVPAAHGPVFAGESCYDAGARLLEQVFGLFDVELFEAATFSQSATSPEGNSTVTLFLSARTSAIPRLSDQDNPEGLFVDQEEFRAITYNYPYMVTPFWNQVIPYFFPDPLQYT